ncbi:MAG: hypothetical protein KKC71_12380, partial [Chloroflexi bacterium]|nr:hypothetical protein [Chloroflexota bacterium]
MASKRIWHNQKKDGLVCLYTEFECSFGAVYYNVSDGSATPEVFSVPVNQNTWKGGQVWLGYLSLGYNKSF